MLPWPDRLLDLALRSLTAVLLACAACTAVLVATLAVELLHDAELGPAVRVQHAAAPWASSP